MSTGELDRLMEIADTLEDPSYPTALIDQMMCPDGWEQDIDLEDLVPFTPGKWLDQLGPAPDQGISTFH